MSSLTIRSTVPCLFSVITQPYINVIPAAPATMVTIDALGKSDGI